MCQLLTYSNHAELYRCCGISRHLEEKFSGGSPCSCSPDLEYPWEKENGKTSLCWIYLVKEVLVVCIFRSPPIDISYKGKISSGKTISIFHHLPRGIWRDHLYFLLLYVNYRIWRKLKGTIILNRRWYSWYSYRLRAGWPGVDSRFSTASITALGSTQPPTWWVPWAFPRC